jgi:hypothetical protein
MRGSETTEYCKLRFIDEYNSNLQANLSSRYLIHHNYLIYGFSFSSVVPLLRQSLPCEHMMNVIYIPNLGI